MEWYDYEEEEEAEPRVEAQRWRKGGGEKGRGENGHEGKGDDGMVILTTSSIPRWREGGRKRGGHARVRVRRRAEARRGEDGPFQAGRDARYEGEEGI